MLDLGSQTELLAGVVMGALAKTVGLCVLARHQGRQYRQVGTVSELYVYPVKSCGSMVVSEATATRVGLSSGGLTDRHWMILYKDTKGKPNMRTDPKLTMVKTTVQGDKIRLQAPDMPALVLPMEGDHNKKVVLNMSTITGDKPTSCEDPETYVIDCGPEADEWVSQYLGRPCRMIYSCEALSQRDLMTQPRGWDNAARAGDKTVFSYLTSYLVTTTASLNEVNAHLDDPVASVNFRPSIVINNTVAWEEDNWKWLKIGEHAIFHAVEPCLRCVITTIDPKKGKRRPDNQPLKLLKSYRCRAPYGNAPVYGSYMSNDVIGEVKVGDPVYAIAEATRPDGVTVF